MKIFWTPNVNRAIEADPVLAVAVEAMRREPTEGYLSLSRSDSRSPFSARYTAPDGTQRRVEARDLIDAILGAVDPQVAA